MSHTDAVLELAGHDGFDISGMKKLWLDLLKLELKLCKVDKHPSVNSCQLSFLLQGAGPSCGTASQNSCLFFCYLSTMQTKKHFVSDSNYIIENVTVLRPSVVCELWLKGLQWSLFT